MDLSFPVCVFTLLIVGCSYAQEIVINPAVDEVTKKVNGDSFTFVCSVSGLPEGENAELKWKDPRDDVIGAFSSDTNDVRNRIYVLDLFDNEERLQFEKLTGDPDAGVYTCEGTVQGKPISKQIKVLLSKEIEVLSEDKQYPVVNTTAVIECVTTFKVAPKIIWLNGNNMKPITLNDRYQQVATGLKIKDIALSDNGVYVCAIFSSKSDSKFFRITVSVTVPPQMKGPATMHPDPVVGKPFALTCIADGTPKPDFIFQKGGKRLEGGRYDVSVNKNPQIDQSEGILKIEELVDTDRGDYVCIAENIGGKVEQTVNVDVQVPPTVNPIQRTTANEGKPGELVCQARANPQASLQWKITGTDININEDKSKGITITERSEQENDIYIMTTSLKFESVKPSDTNNYTCIATNPAGTDQKIGEIIVKFKPNFANTPYNATYGWLNHDAKIKCVVDAVPSPIINWFKGEEAITDGGDYKITTQEGVRQLTSFLTVSVNIANENSIFGEYTCKAQNLVDEASRKILLKRAVPPKAALVSFGTVTPTSIELVIKPPADNGGQPIIDYKIEYHPQGQKANLSRLVAEVSKDPRESRSRSVITGLKAKTVYVVNVWARNNVDYGEKSRETAQETAPLSVPGAPKISPNNPKNANSITLVWERPNTGGAPITGYTIKYTKVEMKSSNEVKKYLSETVTVPVGGDKTSKKVSGLDANSDYELQLVAVNSVGESMASTLYFKTVQGGMAATGGAVSMHVGLLSMLLSLLSVASAVAASAVAASVW